MKTNARTLFSVFCIAVTAFAAPSAKAQLNMYFSTNGAVNGYDDTNIWITILRGQAAATPITSNNLPDITFVNNTSQQAFTWSEVTNIVTNYTPTETNYSTNVGSSYSESITLHDVAVNGGLRWFGNAPSAQVIISYGSPLPSTNSFYATGQLAANNPADPSFTIAYQNFELTYNGGTGDQGDITAINYVGSELGIRSFSGSASNSGTLLQQVGYSQPTAQLLKTLTSNLPPSTFSNAVSSAVVTNSSGQIVRIVGPASLNVAGYDGAYTNFNSYLGSIQAQTNHSLDTVITNFAGYNSIPVVSTNPLSPNSTYTNALFSFNLTNQITGDATNGYGMVASGNIVIVTYSITNAVLVPGSLTTNNYTNITMVVPPSITNGLASNNAAALIYGASPANVYFSNNNSFTDFSNAISKFVTGAGANAFVDTTSQMPGELSAAFSFGLAGSTNLVTNSLGTNMIGALPSDQWWVASNGVLPYTNAQTNPAFYNDYAAAIYAAASSNSIYGFAYGDRFPGATPLVNSVQYNHTNVGSWIIDIGTPLTTANSAVPEPSYTWVILLSLTGLVTFKSMKSRKKFGDQG